VEVGLLAGPGKMQAADPCPRSVCPATPTETLDDDPQKFGMDRHERQRQGRRTKLLHHLSTLETSTASPSVSGWVGALIGFRHAGQAAVRICRGREGTT